jgi:hypothetical protein
MLAVALAFAMGTALGGVERGEIVCEHEDVPVKIARTMYVLRQVTRCYHPATQLDELQKACDLLLTAYGEEEGRARCQALLEEADASR